MVNPPAPFSVVWAALGWVGAFKAKSIPALYIDLFTVYIWSQEDAP